ncbi:MAG: cysteine synthase B [Cognaticolwellia sp.]|jgi:cysteine synthase B
MSAPPPCPNLVGDSTSRVGNTPLQRLCRIPVTAGISDDVAIYAKLEWTNPGGSVKDRAALSIVKDAWEKGLLKSGMTLLDASSGNTGIAYAWIAAARGFKLKLCLPKNANAERKRILRAYGVDIELTSPLEGSDGAIRRARELASEHPDRYFYADQYSNPANWQAHYRSTGPEIWRDTQGQVTHFVSGLGTSGTCMGTGRFLKEQNASIRVASVEPNSPFHGLEGLKHMESAMVPAIYQPEGVVDRAMEAPTEESFSLVRRLAREEGLLAGVSSGAALWAALELGKELTAQGQVGCIVVLFPDGGSRYLSEDHIWEGE